MDTIEDVDIDSGKFKYILITVKDKETGQAKTIARGTRDAPFHGDILDIVEPAIKRVSKHFDLDCIGGGRMIHNPTEKTIKVYGYSQGYGKADHSVACDLLKKKYPNYISIDWSDEGY